MWMRNGLFALVMLVLCFTMVAAETVKGKAVKLDATSVTVTSKKNKDGKAYDLAKGVKYFQEVAKDDKVEKTEIKADAAAKLVGDKGVGVVLTTADDGADKGKVVEVTFTAQKKKKAQ